MNVKRWQFLKRLLGGGLGVAVAPVAGAASSALAKRTPVYGSNVRGFQYHEGPEVMHRLRVGDALELRREPANPHDRNAVAVHWKSHHLGYLPAEENVSLATMLDQGLKLEAHIGALDPNAPAWAQCSVAVELVG